MSGPGRLSREAVVEIFGGLQDLSDLAKLVDDGDGRDADVEEFGLDEIGSGASAVVAAFPGNDDLVVRISEESDGWIDWACGPEHPIRPEVLAIAWTGEVWVSVCQRMSFPEWGDAEDFCKAIGRSSDINEEPEDADLGAALTGFMLDDVEVRNVMTREDGQLVLNDPQSFMGYARICRMKAMFDLDSGTEPIIEDDLSASEHVFATP